jgi:HEAT repeat protein
MSFDPFSDFFDIDPLFSSRRRPTDAEIEEIIERFIDDTLSIAEAEAAMERLARAQKRVLPRLLDMAASPDPRLHVTAMTLLREMDLTRATKPLHQLLEDPNLDDDHKMAILHTMQALGGLSPDENPFVYLRDPETMFRKSQDAILNSFQDPLQLETVLQTMLEGNMPVQKNPEILSAMAYTQDRRVLPLLLCLLHAPDDAIVIGAIEALQVLQDPGTIPILEERARYDPSQEVRQTAQEAAAYLIAEAGSRPPSIFELPIAPPPLARCIISTLDGSGGQIVVIVRQAPEAEGTYLFWDLMFNDHEGIKDCFGGQSYDADEVEEMIVDGLAEVGIELVEISLERARTEIERAYQTTLKAGRRLPLSYMGWQSWLQGEDPEPVAVFPLPEITPDEQANLLERCGELTDLDEFESWFFNPEELGGIERKFRQLAKQGGTDDAIEALISQGINAIVDDQRRRLLQARLQRQAWLLAQIYEDEEIPKLALAAADALSDKAGLPLEEHPLLREMMFESFFNAAGWGI